MRVIYVEMTDANNRFAVSERVNWEQSKVIWGTSSHWTNTYTLNSRLTDSWDAISYYCLGLHCVHEKTVPLDNVR